MFDDEAQLANFGMENRSSSEESSPGFNFSLNPRKNLKASFDREVSRLSNDLVVKQTATTSVVPSCVSMPTKEKTTVRPPLHRNPSSRRQVVTDNGSSSSSSSANRKVAVYLRIRPPPPLKKKVFGGANKDSSSNNNTIEILDPTTEPGRFPTRIRTYPPKSSNSYRVNINRQAQDASAYAKEFDFDCIMGPETSQRTVYSSVAAPMLQDLLQSIEQQQQPSMASAPRSSTNESALLFSYGITNAGKTHTVLGDLNSKNQSDWGIIPRALNDVFDHTRLQANTKSSSGPQSSHLQSQLQLYVSYFEIYNEQVYDLIPSKSTMSKYPLGHAPPLKVREFHGETMVRGLAKHKVHDTAHGIELTKLAQTKRRTSSNNINSDSSRSHFVCQMQIVQTTSASDILDSNDDDDASTAMSMSEYSTDEEATMAHRQKRSTVWIVDLAGSERSKRTQVGSMRQKESTQINKSLMTLMRCLNAVKDSSHHGSSIIPFRESKLTHIFMSHLTSRSAARTAIMVNVSPAIDDFDETQHVLAYATKAKLIQIDADEYSRKRKKYFGEEYDMNGRKKVKPVLLKSSQQKRSPSKKKETLLARVAKKLSPKRVFKKTPGPKKALVALSSNLSTTKEDLETLRSALFEAQARIETLEHDNAHIQEEMENKEDQIRSEVAGEMEGHMRETRRRHQEKIQQVQQQLIKEASKSSLTLKMDQAESHLEELMDKLDECEKENIRMNQDHLKDVEAFAKEIEDLKAQLNEALHSKQEGDMRIETLEKQLKQYKKKLRKLEKHETPKKEGIEGDGKLDTENFNAPCFESDDITPFGPFKIALPGSKKKAAYNRKLRPRNPLSNASNNIA